MADIFNYESGHYPEGIPVSGTADSDSIYNKGSSVTINGGAGNDSINNIGWGVSISGDDGNDSISNKENSVTIDGGADDDSIQSTGDFVLIDGNEGNDSLHNNSGYGVKLIGGAGNDSIFNGHRFGDKGGDKVTINAGAGDDSIYNRDGENVLIEYNEGDGNDTIENFESRPTLQIGDGTGTYTVVYSHLWTTILGVGDSTISLDSPWSSTYNVHIMGVNVLNQVGTEDDDTMQNTIDGATIKPLDGNDSVTNYGDSVEIEAYYGNNYIYNEGSGVTIEAGTKYATVDVDNKGSNTKIKGSWNNDSINNEGTSVTIDGNSGDDYIENSGASALIYGGGENDNIKNSGASAYIDGDAGNDYIHNTGNDSTINGDWGDDTISNTGENLLVIYTLGGGNDLIEGFNETSTLKIEQGFGVLKNDTYSLTHSNNDVIVTVSEGQITLVNAASLSSINIVRASLSFTLTEGNDTYNNNLNGATLQALAGNDSIENYAKNTSIVGGDGNDTLINKTSYLSTKTETITETIQVDEPIYEKKEQTVDETVGYKDVYDDVVERYTDYETKYRRKSRWVTDYWGTGSGRIEYYDEPYTVSVTKYRTVRQKVDEEPIVKKVTKKVDVQVGTKKVTKTVTKDVEVPVTIETNNSNSTLSGGAGDDYIVNEAANFVYVYNAGDGNDTIKGFREDSKLSISGAEYSSVKSGANTIITVGDGSITLVDLLDTYFGSDGDDSIRNAKSNFSINGGASNDTIENGGDNVTIDGGTGDDSISNSGMHVSINGGTGDDFISNSNSNVLFQYAAGDGNDTIQGFNDSSTLLIKGNFSTVKSGKDVIVTVGDGEIKLVDAADLVEINILEDFQQTDDAADDFADDAADDFADDAADDFADDAADDFADDAADDSVDDAADDFADDAADDSVDDAADDSVDDAADDFADDAANDSVDDAADDSVDDAADDSVDDAADDFADDAADDFADDAADDFADDAADDFADDAADDSVDDAADDFADDAADDTDNDITNIFKIDKVKERFVNLKPRYKVADAAKHKKPIQITGNALDNFLIGGKRNDTLDGTGGNNTLTGGKGKDLFLYKGGKGFITDYDKKDRIDVGSFAYADFKINNKDLTFHFDRENSLTIQNGANKFINMNSEVNFYTTDGVFDKKKKSIKLSATTEKFTADSKVEVIDGTATGAIEITGNKKKNYIMAGASGATLDGSKGNDTLVGGDGADVFIYENKSGKDVIENFGDGDLISLDSKVEIKDVKTKRGDTVLKFKGGSLTVKGTTEFNIGDTLYSDGLFIAGDTAKIYGSFKKSIDLADNVKNFDGSLGKKKFKITGNELDNELIGGKKNDKLWGGEGADTFIYQASNGKDTIMDYDFAQGDLLQIFDKKGEAGDFKEATFKKDTLTLSIQGGGKVSFSGVTSDTSININGTSQKVSDLIK